VHESRPTTIPARIASLARLVPPGSRVADIGTDHGLLPLHLVTSGRASFCIATEPSEARLAKARRLASRAAASGVLELRVGDGLEPLRPSDGVDILVMAGLGGRTIVRLLQHPRRGALRVRKVLVQPQGDAGVVRQWMVGHGLGITEEDLVLDRERFYVVILAENGASTALEHPLLSPDDLLEAGPRLISSAGPELRLYWQRRLERHESILDRARPGPGHREAVRQRDLAVRILAALA
jgi:tRNA (adenine22-N1)-methyltransferase